MTIEEQSHMESNIINEQRENKNQRKRHGSRNQHRHKLLMKYLLEKFPSSFRDAQDSSSHHILDVAGGKGELTARMTLCHSTNVVLVDPRVADVLKVFQNTVFRSLPKKWQEKISAQDSKDIAKKLDERFKQLIMNFPMDGSKDFDIVKELEKNYDLLQAVENCTLMLGIHADGATESIVDIALHYRKPFMVVPCCVFPNLFKDRMVPSGIDEDTFIPVRNHEQLCHYLARKDSHFTIETLPFEGRNIAICWDGTKKDGDE